MRELSVFEAATEGPTRDCFVVEGRVLSYADVADRVRQAIDELGRHGVSPGQRVGLSPGVDLDSVVWLLALFELGCPAVLLHPSLTDAERAEILEETHPVHVVGESGSRDGVASVAGGDSVPPGRCLAIVYTSGTKGKPRGAILSRRAFVASSEAHTANLGWTTTDRWLLSIPPAHVGGLSILTRSLIARRCVVLSSGPFDAPRIIETLDAQGVTLLSVVPTMLRRLLACEEPRWGASDSLRAVLVGGARFPPALREHAHDRGIPVLTTYGCTEACSQVTTQHLGEGRATGSGLPLQGVKLRIEQGEIQVAGSMLMDGYVGEGDSGSTWTEDGWLRTGDFGMFGIDGELHVAGRIDDLIITGGENVAPLEVEAVFEAAPGVVAACVFSVPHEDWGQEVVAGLSIDPSRFDRTSLHECLAERLAPYKRPKRISVVDTLPVGRSGKIDRDAVKALCQDTLEPI